jgi:tRNA(His) 5'-end guanylyltransferase
LIYWRQIDATRNSIQMVGQANFSHKELQNKSCNNIQDMLMLQKGINWNDFPTHQKRGSCCVRKVVDVTTKDICEEQEWGEPIIKTVVTTHYDWVIDTEIPIFKGEGREYIECLIQPEEE